MRMLAKEHNILDQGGFARRHQALLQLPRFRVTNQSHIDDVTNLHSALFNK